MFTRTGYRFLTLAVTAAGLAACNPFHHTPAVEVSTRDVDVNARWHASLVTPASLAGAVQMRGSASMTPGSNSGVTDVAVDISNAAPGGVHPWQVHRGQCGADDGVFGPAGSYKALKVGDDGRAAGSAKVPVGIPAYGSYFVTVLASAANTETVVACGNLAPPAR